MNHLSPPLYDLLGGKERYQRALKWAAENKFWSANQIISSISSDSLTYLTIANALTVRAYENANNLTPTEFPSDTGFCSYFDEKIENIIKDGRHIVGVNPDPDEETEITVLFSYTIGNQFSESPCPELITYFDHLETSSYVLNRLSHSLIKDDLNILSDLKVDEVVELHNTLGTYQEFSIKFRLLNHDDRKFFIENAAYQLDQSTPLILVEIPDTAGFFAGETGSPCPYHKGLMPIDLCSGIADRQIHDIWGLQKHPLTSRALRDNLWFILKAIEPDDEPDQKDNKLSPATLSYLWYMVDHFDPDTWNYDDDTSVGQNAFMDDLIHDVQTLINHKTLVSMVSDPHGGNLSVYGHNEAYLCYWLNIKLNPMMLDDLPAEILDRSNFQEDYPDRDAFLKGVNLHAITHFISLAYEDSLNKEITEKRSLHYSLMRNQSLSANEKANLERIIKPKRWTMRWAKKKIKTLLHSFLKFVQLSRPN